MLLHQSLELEKNFSWAPFLLLFCRFAANTQMWIWAVFSFQTTPSSCLSSIVSTISLLTPPVLYQHCVLIVHISHFYPSLILQSKQINPCHRNKHKSICNKITSDILMNSLNEFLFSLFLVCFFWCHHPCFVSKETMTSGSCNCSLQTS